MTRTVCKYVRCICQCILLMPSRVIGKRAWLHLQISHMCWVSIVYSVHTKCMVSFLFQCGFLICECSVGVCVCDAMLYFSPFKEWQDKATTMWRPPSIKSLPPTIGIGTMSELVGCSLSWYASVVAEKGEHGWPNPSFAEVVISY